MIIELLLGEPVAVTCLGDVINILFSVGFDIALFVFFLNHFFDYFCSGGRFR